MESTGSQPKKQLELLHLKQWLSLAPELPAGKIVAHESPDFLLFANKRKAIGIELTRLPDKPESDLAVEWFVQQLVSTIARKADLLGRYSANPQIVGLWLVIVCGDEYYKQVHRFLERAEKQNFCYGFGRIDLLFPLSEKVVNLFFAG